ncbi:ABC transporter permease [Dehalococcoidia bacterium]|nr:ABC transporter permease [Dehalococcoidia bacterium]
MTLSRTVPISKRIVKQVLRDHRSLAMIFVAPLLVMGLLGSNFSNNQETLNFIGPALICTFVLFFTFILTGISFLRERSEGTLERLMTTPISRADIILGYSCSFFIFAVIQSTLILLFSILVLDINYQGSLINMFFVVILLAIVAVNLGVSVSTFAKNEFQVIQFIPLVLGPQIFLSGVIQPVENLPSLLQKVSNVLPLTYAVNALRSIMTEGVNLSDVASDILILGIFALLFVVLASTTIRK